MINRAEGIRKRLERVEAYFRLNTYRVISNACIDNIVKYTLSYALCQTDLSSRFWNLKKFTKLDSKHMAAQYATIFYKENEDDVVKKFVRIQKTLNDNVLPKINEICKRHKFYDLNLLYLHYLCKNFGIHGETVHTHKKGEELIDQEIIDFEKTTMNGKENLTKLLVLLDIKKTFCL